MNSLELYWIAFAGAIVMWISFLIGTLMIKHPPKQEERKRDRTSMIGIGLQGIAYAAVWALRRRFGEPIVAMPLGVQAALTVVTMALAAGSVWMTLAAMRTLGKQWSYQARLIEGHRLVTEGPYRIVRNPIYSGMFGMLIVTGLANSHWIVLAGGAVLFLIGTLIRVRAEEKLMREAFGAEFEDYARRVSALIPWLG